MSGKAMILLVEDEPRIRTGLKDFLEFHGYQVAEAVDGQEAADLVEQRRFDLILLDLMLPRISGEELCRRWRQKGLQTPIIMLTAKGQEYQRVAGLDLGADDYVTKPFSLEELRARIEAVLRRMDPQRGVGQIFEFGPWQVNIGGLTIKSGDTTQDLSPREAQILQYFAGRCGQVVSRRELYEQVWKDTWSDLGSRTVDMHIAKLRGKIEVDSANPRMILTIRGAGYKYEGGPCTGD